VDCFRVADDPDGAANFQTSTWGQRYHLFVQGLVDHPIPPDSRDVGTCIYCGECDAPLSTEHAVPYGLNGPWTLLRASCEACAKITTRFERGALRQLWPDVRNALAMQSRRKDKRSPTLPVVIQRNGIRDTVQISRANYPTYLPTPLFPPPGKLWTRTPVRGVFTNLDVQHLCGPTLEDAIKEYPGAEFFGMHINFSAEDFARMIAKIGFCAGVAAVGLGAFTNTPVRNIILGNDKNIGHWVGGWWDDSVNSTQGSLHEIRVLFNPLESDLHAVVRLFAQFGAPEYHVMLGPVDPGFVASADWPTMWRVAELSSF
jgi:hypothetical protein